MPQHDFVVVDRVTVNEHSYTFYRWDSTGQLYREGLLREDHVSIDDELITYMNDSLQWIETWNPSMKE